MIVHDAHHRVLRPCLSVVRPTMAPPTHTVIFGDNPTTLWVVFGGSSVNRKVEKVLTYSVLAENLTIVLKLLRTPHTNEVHSWAYPGKIRCDALTYHWLGVALYDTSGELPIPTHIAAS